MTTIRKVAAAVILVGTAMCGTYNGRAYAGDGPAAGDLQIRLLATDVVTDNGVGSVSLNGFAIAGEGVDVDDAIIPAITLTYFFTPNIATELFCCVANVDVDAKGPVSQRDLLSTSFFAPALTLQYHFNPGGKLKPYVGAGAQYLLFYDTDAGNGGNLLGFTKADIDNAFGFTAQAGLDVQLGSGWSFNLDVKKTWLDTDVTLTGAGGVLRANDVELDPWIVSVGIGYRFNLFDRDVASLK